MTGGLADLSHGDPKGTGNRDAEIPDTGTQDTGNRGAIIRLFGVILIILGTLDVMLSWRGGFSVVPFHAMLIVAGVALCLIGAIRRQGGPSGRERPGSGGPGR